MSDQLLAGGGLGNTNGHYRVNGHKRIRLLSGYHIPSPVLPPRGGSAADCEVGCNALWHSLIPQTLLTFCIRDPIVLISLLIYKKIDLESDKCSEGNHMPRDRQSEWLVIVRCLAILRRLMVGDTPTNDLIEIIRRYEDPSAPAPDDSLRDKLEKDIRRLRHFLQHEISYLPAEKAYRLENLAHPLIDLPEEAVRGLAFLERTFSPAEIPYRDEVTRLLDIIRFILPEERAEQVGQMRGLLEIELRSRDSKDLDPELLEKLSRACSTHHEIEFNYRSPRHLDQVPRRHRVEPYRFYLEPVRRHYILDAYQLEISAPYQMLLNRMGTYRIERMTDLTILPKRFVPRQIRKEGHEIIYRLTPEIARLRDVTAYVPDSEITYLPDGGAEVRAVSFNLFHDLRTLLHYGANCEVIGGDKALAQMKALVQGLARVYEV